MNLLQLTHPRHGRRIGLVKEPSIVLLSTSFTSMYEFFKNVLASGKTVEEAVNEVKSNEILMYDPIYKGNSDWRILPPIDCPDNLLLCMISGTGLTHKASAANRQRMHESEKAQNLTDSMKMYLLGEEGGKPQPGSIGVQPEWFYKGNGLNLKGHADQLTVPHYADDGGDEPEIAGVYLVSSQGIPCRIGFVQGNEFSDHVMEKKNYLYLAPSKIRNCAIGPELVLNCAFDSIPGKASIVRDGRVQWAKDVFTGEAAMAHTLANLEHHHFKYAQHRIPGQLHIHFFGASAFSFGDNVKLQNNDEMHVSFENMGRPLVNTVAIDETARELYSVNVLR